MRLKLQDGNTIDVKFSEANCTGYVASEITIFADDIVAIRQLAENRPVDFQKSMLQLENRFPSKRGCQS